MPRRNKFFFFFLFDVCWLSTSCLFAGRSGSDATPVGIYIGLLSLPPPPPLLHFLFSFSFFLRRTTSINIQHSLSSSQHYCFDTLFSSFKGKEKRKEKLSFYNVNSAVLCRALKDERDILSLLPLRHRTRVTRLFLLVYYRGEMCRVRPI